MNSLRLRLLLSLAVILLVFFGVTGWSLFQAYTQTTLQALQDRQRLQSDALQAVMEVENGVPKLPQSLPDQALIIPNSGVVAWIVNPQGQIAWRSASSLSLSLPGKSRQVGDVLFQLMTMDGGDFDGFAMGLEWLDLKGDSTRFTLWVAQDRRLFDAKLDYFRTRLWWALSIACGLLLLVMAVLLRWAMKPLNKAADDIAQVREGRMVQLEDNYPHELRPLTRSVNQLIHNEQEQRQRYRHAMDDLAHSLKTPIAVLQGDGDLSEVQRQALTRINDIVSYQLQRATSRHKATFTAKRPVRPVAEKVLSALGKVYRDKSLEFEIQLGDDCQWAMDDAEMMEVLGNLLDNACKWAKGHVVISGDVVSLIIEDDGPGFGTSSEALLIRGRRADETSPGQGLGLGLVADIIDAHGARIELGSSSRLGGARVAIVIDV